MTSRLAQIEGYETIGGEIITRASAARCLMRFTFDARRFAELWYEELSDLLSITEKSRVQRHRPQPMYADQHSLFAEPPSKRNWTLSPSEFGFLWQECKRCYYLKVTQKYNRPGTFPKIFQAIDAQMRACFDRRRTEEVLPELPPGRLDCTDQRVQSIPVRSANRDSSLQIRGKLDALIRFDDGSAAVVDFKTTSVSGRNVETYTRQLSAYAYALEHPSPGYLSLQPIRRLGLLIFEPRSFSSQASTASFAGSLSWVEIPFDHEVFLKFLEEVASVLDLEAAPPTTDGCTWCAYRESARQTGY